MSDINETVAPLATEAGQDAIVLAINNISSFSYAVRAENAATTATQKASDASNSAADALAYRNAARNWATKMDTYVDTETITIPAEQEGEEDTTETVYLFSARYYAALAQDFYNNMTFDNAPTQNSTNLLTSGTIYTALADKADKSTTYTKTETDNLINTRLAELVASAPAALDTLQELATALGNDPNFATTIATQLGNKADKSDTYTKTEVDTALSNVQGQLTFDNVPTANSDNPVKSSGIKTALDGKQNTLTFDSTPTANSTNPVTSGGIYTALQNVNIDIDDEITEDSDNPVTSAAIYEALQNFTPSGGGGSAGNASGVQIDTLYTGNNSLLLVNDELNLTSSWKDYDILEFVYFPKNGTLADNNPYSNQRFITTNTIKECYSLNLNFRIGIFSNNLSNNSRLVSLRVPSDTKFVVNTIGESNSDYSLNIKYIYGIKFSKNLSEQMYSNVLWKTSSTTITSGTITLNDSWRNYDLIVFTGGNSWHSSKFFTKNEISSWKENNQRININDANGSGSNWGLRSVFNIIDDTHFEFTSDLGANNNNGLYSIVGIKLAKGGYSGIVSDARMTVKSGTVEFPSILNSDSGSNIDITFDYPMPDINYIVLFCNATTGYYWPELSPTARNKTINGFKLYIHNNGSGATAEKPKFDWIAIRPNSYTREGMVEDIVYTTSTGFTTGTINLSGNISDYDLIEFVIGDSTDGEKYTSNHVYSSSVLTNIMGQQNKFFYLVYYGGGWLMISVDSDNQLSCSNRSGNTVLYKITGIKFGRYVSGVAVDTTVTQNSNAVVTSGAVYNALQNIPTGSGGGGSITIDSVPTENSQNAVSSGGVYDALQNIPSGSSTTVDSTITYNSQNPVTSAAIYSALVNGFAADFAGLIPLSSNAQDNMYVDTAGVDLFELSWRHAYKKYNGYAAGVIALVGSNNNVHAVLVSTQEDNVKMYNSYDTNYTSSAYSFTYDGSTYYYSASPYGWDNLDINNMSNKSIKAVSTHYDNNELVARYILSEILTPTPKTLSDYNITNAYTKTEVDTLLQNAGGGSSITLDITPTQNSNNPVTSDGIYSCLANVLSLSGTQLKDDGVYYLDKAGDIIIKKGTYGNIVKTNDGAAIGFAYNYYGWVNAGLIALNDNAAKINSTNSNGGQDSGTYTDSNGRVWYYYTQNCNTSDYSEEIIPIMYNKQDINYSKSQIVADALTNAVNAILNTYVISKDTTPTQNSNNLITSGGVYTALGNKADSATTLSGYGITDAYTKTEVDTALASKGDVTTNTDQNITGTKTFVGSKKVGFKQSTANDKLGFTLYGNTGTERGYLEFNPTNTVDGVTGLMTLGNYATSAAGLTQVGFRRYSNISGASGAYNLLMPMVADAKTPFSLTTTYQNFYLPLGFTDGTTTVRTAKSGVVDLSPLLASLEARIAALEGN